MFVALSLLLAGSAAAQEPAKRAAVPVEPALTEFFFDILQTIPVSPTVAGLPALPGGVFSTARCIEGTPDGLAPGSFVPIRFVGNVLCIDPGPNGNFESFLCGEDCPPDTVPVLQGVTLRKVEPAVPKCPDVYPGLDHLMTPRTTGIRTWWPLKHTPPGTEFILSLEVALVRPPGQGPRQSPLQVRLRSFRFRVVVTADTLAWVLHALHNQPLGVCEVPCITDEGLFELLLRQAETVRLRGTPVEAAVRRVEEARRRGLTAELSAALAALAGLRSTLLELNTALDVMEATIVTRAIFTQAAWRVERDASGAITRVIPCALFPGDGPWGNFTVADFGWGLVDTLENPCACKLVADLTWLKRRLIGSDP